MNVYISFDKRNTSRDLALIVSVAFAKELDQIELFVGDSGLEELPCSHCVEYYTYWIGEQHLSAYTPVEPAKIGLEKKKSS